MTKDTDTSNVLGFRVPVTAHNCRVAYTLNDRQPVLCSIIGDQPLFYMDYEIAGEDLDYLDEDLVFDDIDAGIARLEEKLLIMDKVPAGLAHDSLEPDSAVSEIMEKFLQAARGITEKNSGKPARHNEPCKALVESLRTSRLAATYISFAETAGVGLVYNEQTETAFYDRDSGNIFVNPALSDEDQILMAARELRRFWQHKNGVLLHPLLFHPDQAILVNRAQRADLAVTMIRIAWELQIAGEKAAWQRVMDSSMRDLGQAFARESFLDFRALNNGKAAGAVFESWFLSARCEEADRALIQQMLADYSGFVFEHAETSQTVTADIIGALGKMPFGKNYLVPYAEMILSDPLFTDVRDRSNANFLWFVKFEQSFKQAARDLQPRKPVHSGTGSGAVHNQKDDGRMGSDEQAGKIYYLPEINCEPKTGEKRYYSDPRRPEPGERPEE